MLLVLLQQYVETRLPRNCCTRFFFVKLGINNHIVGLVHKNHIINEIQIKNVQQTCLMYHAACKVEFQAVFSKSKNVSCEYGR